MKEQLNPSGTALVQASELSKTLAERAASMILLQTDFYQWMHDRFDLSLRQQEQIKNLPADFVSTMTEAIAQELMAGRSVAFAKEDPKEEQEDKDILLFSSHRQAYSFVSGAQAGDGGLQIVIRYR